MLPQRIPAIARHLLRACMVCLPLAVAGCNGTLADVGASGGAGGATVGSGSPVTTTTGSPTTASAAPTTSSGPSATGSGNGGAGATTDASSSASTGSGLPDGPSSQRLSMRPIGTVADAPLGYAEYLPPGYGDGAKRPLLLFHHGISESGDGTDGVVQKVLTTGMTALIAHDQWPSDRPFIVLASQHNAPPGTSCHTVDEITQFMQFATTHYDVDMSRVYITGLSCGAIGSWNYLGAHTNEVVAAAVLISGDGRGAFQQAGCNLGNVPIWAFHGELDGTVDPNGSIQTIHSLQACTNPVAVDAELTTYPGVGHDAWDMTYDLTAGHDVYSWLLGHQHP